MKRRVNSEKLENILDASHPHLVALWHTAGALFPTSFVLSFRVLEPSQDVIESAAAYGQIPTVFVSASLSCGHIVKVPEEIAIRRGARVSDEDGKSFKSKCRVILPCYRCWMLGGGAIAGLVCSFCGVPHPFELSCARPPM